MTPAPPALAPRVAALAGAVALTLAIHAAVGHWTADGAPVLGPDPCADAAPWTPGPGDGTHTCTDRVLSLENGPSHSQSRVHRVVELPPGVRFVRFAATGSLDAGDGELSSGVVSMVQLDEGSARWEYLHPDLPIADGHARAAQAVARIGPDIVRILVAVRLGGPASRLTVERIELQPVRPRTAFVVARTAAAAAGAAAAAWLAIGWLAAPSSRVWRYAAVALVILIVVGTMVPGPQSRRAGQRLETAVSEKLIEIERKTERSETAAARTPSPSPAPTGRTEPGRAEAATPKPSSAPGSGTQSAGAPKTARSPAGAETESARSADAEEAEGTAPGPSWSERFDALDFNAIKKAAHALLFALLGAAVHRGLDRRAGLAALAGLFVVAIAAETMQLYAIGRSPLPADALINVSGALAGWAISALIRSPRRAAATTEQGAAR